MSHLKTEIIYYCDKTDFEFEFNLNATSPMRLFTDCPDNEKGFLSSLSLAVSRSRIIFITAVFEDKFVETIANAIGFRTETIIPEEYGIIEKLSNKFISGGVPLVTSNGVYAGIILESGPQSLILITNNRAIRKQLMSELVKGYILDLSEAPNEPVRTVVTDNTVNSNEAQSIITEDISTAELSSSSSQEMETKVEPEAIEENINTDVISDNSGDTEIADYFFEEQPKRKVAKKKSVFTAILAIILFLLIAFIVYSLVIEPFLNDISITDNFKQIFGFLFE